MRQCKKKKDHCSIFEENTALNVSVGGFAKMTILPLGSCTCLFMSNFTGESNACCDYTRTKSNK